MYPIRNVRNKIVRKFSTFELLNNYKGLILLEKECRNCYHAHFMGAWHYDDRNPTISHLLQLLLKYLALLFKYSFIDKYIKIGKCTMLRRAQHDIFVSFLMKLRHPEPARKGSITCQIWSTNTKKLRKHTCVIIN